MKLSIICLLTIAAFSTAATISYTYHPGKVQTAEIDVYKQKQFILQCSPLYIPSEDESIPPLEGWGNYSWKISTSSDSAQFYFDQGLNMYYAFHIIESRASFDKATHFDSACAMAWWGKALAFGPNINDFGYEPPSEALPSATKANSLKNNGTNIEKALIEAMAVRYSADSASDQNKLNVLYKDEMNKVYETYGGNADVTALYADALMLLHPWDLYNHDYSPKQWTPEIITVLKNAFKININHPAANHYYIHVVEASARPQEALRSAEFLSNAMPNVSHITHMPSHIYIRTGYYNKGIEMNDKAVRGFKKYSQSFAPVANGAFLYSLHNLHMKMSCAQMAGNYQLSMETAKQLQENIPVFYLSAPGAIGNSVQYIYQSPLFTQLRFGKWEEILEEKVVDSLSFTPVLQHFARGLAFAKTMRAIEAEKELELMKIKMNNPSLKTPIIPFNAAYDVAIVAENILEGVIAAQKKDYPDAITFLQKAVQAEDNLVYNEPRDWILPARQYLGDVLLKAGKYNEALAVFEADLAINPNNGWDLTGIKEVFEKQHKTTSLAKLNPRLKNAWLIKDVPINGAVF